MHRLLAHHYRPPPRSGLPVAGNPDANGVTPLKVLRTSLERAARKCKASGAIRSALRIGRAHSPLPRGHRHSSVVGGELGSVSKTSSKMKTLHVGFGLFL